MAQTHAGAMKVLARKASVRLRELKSLHRSGFKWCYKCRDWKARTEFKIDRSRWDGRCSLCTYCRSAECKRRYKPKPRVSKKGARYAPIRDGDKRQARARVNILVKIGLLPHPNSLPCADCGDTKKRHSYDHHLGYSAEHQEHVEPVCYKCHDKRSRMRGESTRARGERSAKAILTEKIVRQIRSRRIRTGESFEKLARRFKTSHSNVESIVKRRSWTWLA